MLKTLDILIGTATVLLLFSMAVTVITQAIGSILQHRGKQLLRGLTDLLQQLGVSQRELAGEVAEALLKHPLIAAADARLGTIIHREEFTKLLLDFASTNGASQLEPAAKQALIEVLKANGVSDPGQALKNIWAMALQIEASNPELANQTRDSLAILHESGSAFVARVHSWFDQTIDRCNHRFANLTHWVTIGVATIIVLAVQLDVIGVIDRLSMDDQARGAIVSHATQQFSSAAGASAEGNPAATYSLVNASGLITLPTSREWVKQISSGRKVPGMLFSILLLSLGAPFWYNILKDFIGLRSQLARNDEAQRRQRQTNPDGDQPTNSDQATASAPNWLSGERGDLAAIG